nr:MAG: adenosylmethionine--8-amino-7-oxononanoate transaminase [Pseudomonadota bacterium]
MGPYLEGAEPLVIERASGARLYDANGKSYIDANSSWWCAVLGHDHPRLVAAVSEQLRRMPHVPLAGITHAPAAELAAELVARAPSGLSRVFYSDNGSTAVEVAMKLCLQYWHQNGRPERTRFVALEGAFHGETLGVTALGGVETFRRPFASVVLDCIHVPSEPDGYERAFAALERALAGAADTIAAVVLEPVVQGAAGMRMYDPALLRAARELTRRHDLFLVVDEVFTGLGRTGPFWAVEHAAVAPDVLCTSKALGGGFLPFAATLVSDRIFDGFLGEPERAFFYGHTYCGNPLGARLALEVLRVFDEERVLEGVRTRAAVVARAFERLRALPGVTRTRALGMIGAADLGERAGYLEPVGQRVYREALARGAYLRPLGNTIYVAPPLNIPENDLAELLDIVEESVRAALA